MRLDFNLHFLTQPNEGLWVEWHTPTDPTPHKLPLHPDATGGWSGQLTLDSGATDAHDGAIYYRYLVCDGERTVYREVGPARRIQNASHLQTMYLQDEWQGNTEDALFLTAPYVKTLYPQPTPVVAPPAPGYVFQVTLFNHSPEQGTPCLIGDHPALGAWDPQRALPLQPIGGCRWQVQLPLDAQTSHNLAYKFILRNPKGCRWEDGENRQTHLPALTPFSQYHLDHAATRLPFPRPRLAGTAIPVFSLRRENGYGIGDFTDLKKMVLWAEQTGQHALQLLPINDTTATWNERDSYPYSGISVMALHPIYGNPDAVGDCSWAEEERKRLDAQPTVPYREVLELKWKCWRFLEQELGTTVRQSEAYREFVSRHEAWLLPYAAFCALRDHHRTADFRQWGAEANFTPNLPQQLLAANHPLCRELELHMTVQFWLDQQLTDAVEFAHQHKVVIKGDIPIGITPNSVEAWTEPAFFNRDQQAGAPPDAFAEQGQNWGFPTYNWSALAQDDYRWWKRRFTRMADHFDLYRIDHILGFFRIWEIPRTEIHGLLGHFNPALPLSQAEIEDRGLTFQQAHCTPFLTEAWLQEQLGDLAEDFRAAYLMPASTPSCLEAFTLQPAYATQHSLRKALHEQHPEWVRDAADEDRFLQLCNQRLWVSDPYQPDKVHPCIGAKQTCPYQTLTPAEQAKFDQLFEDFFYHRNEACWSASALQKLPELTAATDLLACAEDLGMIPACVPDVLNRLRIATLEVQRMPKAFGEILGNPAHYPYRCVCTTGTHDTSTLRGWWTEAHPEAEDCPAMTCQALVQDHLNSPAMWTILPWQDWLSTDKELRHPNPHEERINVPSNPHHVWNYRMHLSLESLLQEENFTASLQQMTKSCIL